MQPREARAWQAGLSRDGTVLPTHCSWLAFFFLALESTPTPWVSGALSTGGRDLPPGKYLPQPACPGVLSGGTALGLAGRLEEGPVTEEGLAQGSTPCNGGPPPSPSGLEAVCVSPASACRPALDTAPQGPSCWEGDSWAPPWGQVPACSLPGRRQMQGGGRRGVARRTSGGAAGDLSDLLQVWACPGHAGK